MSNVILGSATASLKSLPVEQAFSLLHGLGVQTVELGAGGYVDTTHLNPKKLLHSGNAVREFKELLDKYELKVSALSCCGNPVHPDRNKAAADHQAFVDSCRLAVALGTDTVVAFSGCPGDCAASKAPNFISHLFPPENRKILEWQWERVLIPYWKETAAIAASYGIRRIAIEMMPGFCVHNPQTLWHLRDEIGSSIGAAFDPAHLIRQGMDPVTALKALSGIVFQFHAKDLLFNTAVRAENGIFDTDPNADNARPVFLRAVGNGHDASYWKSMIDTLKTSGYDRSITIEYDDDTLPAEEGIKLAAAAVKKLL